MAIDMISAALKYILWAVLLVIDKMFNVFPFLGSPHQTISMRVAFAIHCEFVRPRYEWVEKLGKFIDWLFTYIDPDHIWKSYEAHEIISREFWKLYVIVDQAGFEQLKKRMLDNQFIGRVRCNNG
jgi:hypothetical protein